MQRHTRQTDIETLVGRFSEKNYCDTYIQIRQFMLSQFSYFLQPWTKLSVTRGDTGASYRQRMGVGARYGQEEEGRSQQCPGKTVEGRS